MSNLLQKAVQIASGELNAKNTDDYFVELVQSLAELLSADYVFISELQNPQQAKTLAAIADYQIIDNFEYDLNGTPCYDLTLQGLCCFKDHVCEQFPGDTLLAKMNAQAYLGIALRDREQSVVGLLTAVFKKPVVQSDDILQVFNLFQARATAELERQQYEQLLTQTIDELKQQSNSLVVASQVYDFMSDGIIITDVNQKIVYINNAMEEISGYTRDEVMGKNPRVFSSGLHSRQFYKYMWRQLNENGKWQGEFKNRRKNGEIYTINTAMTVIRNGDGQVNNHIAIQKDVTLEKEAREIIAYQTSHDQLTGLLNRYEFNGVIDKTLNRVGKDHSQWAFILIDLDDFKEINESRGHVIGDQVISAVALRLKNIARGAGILSRLGGDEFALFAPANESGQVISTINNMLEVFRFPFILVDGSQFTLTASIGVSLFPSDADKANSLYAHADQALYQAKSQGKNAYVFFTQEMEDRARRQQSVRVRLKKAIAEKAIEPYFQPIVNFATNEVTYCEALARWHDHELGAVYPNEFIPIAENYGLMPELGSCIAEKAIGTIAELNRQLVTPIGIAINRSPREFITCDREPLLEIAVAHKFPVNLITVEITESLMVNDPERAQQQLQELRLAGFKLAMDDFGTGYSSLAYLKQFPFHVLKIDRAFINDLTESQESYTLVKTIIEMANNFKMKTVAEGVETADQLKLLKKLGCDYGQGFYLAKPMTADKLSDYMWEYERKLVTQDKELKQVQRDRLSKMLKQTSALRGN